MTIDNLQQRHHGLPGIGFSSGTNGLDGEGGNNVYFGYINDFFETIKIDADNLIRLATSDDGYYTGMFIKTDNGEKTWAWDSSLLKLGKEQRKQIEDQTRFVEIMEDSSFPGRYRYTFDSSTNNMRMYVKADVAGIGKPNAWNKSMNSLRREGRWLDVVDGEFPFDASVWPYVAYNGTMNRPPMPEDSHANIRPGNYMLSQSDLGGFELFSIKTSSATYQFAFISENDTDTYDSSYEGFLDSASYSIDNPSISQVGVAYAHKTDTSVLRIDFIKYSEEISENIEVLDKLDRNIVAGDVIYFYKDKGDFNIN